MNNLIVNFDHILKQAQDQGLPPKQRAVIREYLQAKIIDDLYNQQAADQLSFVGGTSLRLLRGLPRFSEDLDFDNLGLTDDEIKRLVEQVIANLKLENIEVELKVTQRGYKNYFELKFPQLLKPLGISADPREKLMIKLDYADYWQGQKPETVLLNSFGFVQQVVTNPLNQVLGQKLAAYVERDRTQPRDMFDLVWLYGQGARLDQDFLQANQLGDLLDQAREKFAQEGASQQLKRRLKPFLFKETEVDKLELLGQVLVELA
jgi:predicted nucleotidyltransferase component of viral defense system